MKRFSTLFLALFFTLLFINPVKANIGTKVWLDGYIVDENIPILKENGKIYIPVDKLPQYYGLYSVYKDQENMFLYCEPEYIHSGNAMALIMGHKVSKNDSDEVVARYNEAPRFINGHVYQTISDARIFINNSISYDSTNNILALSSDYSPTKKPFKIKINVDGKEAPSTFKPFLQNSRTMVPLRFITEAIGGQVYWHPELQDGMQGVTIFKTDEDLGLTMWLNKCGAHESELFYRNDTFPVLRGETTYVPLRFVADYLGLQVAWDQNTKTVTLTSGGQRNMNKYLNDDMEWRFEQYIQSEPYSGGFAWIFD